LQPHKKGALIKDLDKLNTYYKYWILQANSSKTDITLFHFNNKNANHKLQLNVYEDKVKTNQHPKYLGMVLDITLTYIEYIIRLAAKIRIRSTVIEKLNKSSLNANGSTLRTNAHSLIYSAAEYYAHMYIK